MIYNDFDLTEKQVFAKQKLIIRSDNKFEITNFKHKMRLLVKYHLYRNENISNKSSTTKCYANHNGIITGKVDQINEMRSFTEYEDFISCDKCGKKLIHKKDIIKCLCESCSESLNNDLNLTNLKKRLFF